jgi:hypothetical protein
VGCTSTTGCWPPTPHATPSSTYPKLVQISVNSRLTIDSWVITA